MPNSIPELVELDEILTSLDKQARVEVLCHVPCQEHRFPVHAVTLGPARDLESPALLVVGGVHGLERIGTQVILAHLKGLCAYLGWDHQLPALLERMRLVFVPLLNPAGVFLHRRSNGHGVDLMRNAPHDASQQASRLLLFRGHRLSPALPWYRGAADAPMEPEARALCEFVERELFQSRLSITLDVHSGFAGRDRLWFPYAGTRELFPQVAELMALKHLLDATVPHHRYVLEPQALHYTAHGDLWDFIYDRHREQQHSGMLLPLTLELASSSWLKKNPRQLLSPLGLFHPMKDHRVRRVLRRHSPLIHFLERATLAGDAWANLDPQRRAELEQEALVLWGKHGLSLASARS